MELTPCVGEAPQTFYCQVCCEDFSDGGFSLAGCGHKFCKECLVGYLSSKVQDGEIAPSCFWSSASTTLAMQTREMTNAKQMCMVKLTDEDMSALLLPDSVDVWNKWDRFKYFKSNALARECPYCNHRQLGLNNSKEKPEMKCENPECNKEYCFLHAGAHAGLTCQDYELREAAESSQSQTLIDQSSKPCPVCKMPITKDGGCNHIKCSFCGATFCWLCGKEVEDAVFPAHFQWWNPSGCANLQMNELDEPTECARTMARLISYAEMLILGPLSAASTLASLVFCCCFVPCMVRQQPNKPSESLPRRILFLLGQCMSGWGMLWIGLLFMLPLSLLGFVALCILSCIRQIIRCLCCIRRPQQPGAAAAAAASAAAAPDRTNSSTTALASASTDPGSSVPSGLGIGLDDSQALALGAVTNFLSAEVSTDLATRSAAPALASAAAAGAEDFPLLLLLEAGARCQILPAGDDVERGTEDGGDELAGVVGRECVAVRPEKHEQEIWMVRLLGPLGAADPGYDELNPMSSLLRVPKARLAVSTRSDVSGAASSISASSSGAASSATVSAQRVDAMLSSLENMLHSGLVSAFAVPAPLSGPATGTATGLEAAEIALGIDLGVDEQNQNQEAAATAGGSLCPTSPISPYSPLSSTDSKV